MIVGTCWVKLFLHENNSLKGKRKVVKSIKDRIRSKFNVSITEIDSHDDWEKIVLGIATVSNDQKFINKVGQISEDEGHHPDISFGWGYAEIKITTHAIEGLSENDFILAAKIDQIINV